MPLTASGEAAGTTTALIVVTWIGAATAVFAALIAIAQNDIKRILAYSTISQLGYMMAGLGLGGVAVGMFHLITHAFFKARLFLGGLHRPGGGQVHQDLRLRTYGLRPRAIGADGVDFPIAPTFRGLGLPKWLSEEEQHRHQQAHNTQYASYPPG